MLENDISDLDKETQDFLKRNPMAMLVYQTLGPPAPEPLFKTREEAVEFERKMREKLDPIFKEYDRAHMRSWLRAKGYVLD